jgi:NADPH:quinone reductase-like Zn-dependent oxidoreductase
MKAFILDRYGSADRVRAGEVPDPELREDDVLVQIYAVTGESAHSRNSVRSKKMTWRSSPKHSPWKKRLPSPWSA